MAYGHYSKRFSYTSPSPSQEDKNHVEELIDTLHNAINTDKLKDIKSTLSKLKLSINNEFPLYTQESCVFTAYVYAKNAGKTKSIDSILAMLMKKNYMYDGLPLLTLATNMKKEDFKIILDDFLLNFDSKWLFEGTQTIRFIYENFPKEADELVKSKRLNKFEKGDVRTETAVIVADLSNDVETIIIGLSTFFDLSYSTQYGVAKSKMNMIREALLSKPKNIIKEVYKKYFYVMLLLDILNEMFFDDFEKDLLDDEIITNYTINKLRRGGKALIELLDQTKNTELKAKLVSANDEVLDYITNNYPEHLPKNITDIFLF